MARSKKRGGKGAIDTTMKDGIARKGSKRGGVKRGGVKRK